jgi:ParB-like chromosome segregation protein Spo0J
MDYKGNSYHTKKAHPAAEKFPFHDDELDKIVESMRVEGFDPTHPIIVDSKSKMIVAGRRRELAALVNDIEPIYKEVDFESESEIIKFIMREELFRRHLKAGQVAIFALELNNMLEESEKMLPHEVAANINVSKQTAYDADKVLKSSPELAEKVKNGEKSVSAAAKLLKKNEVEDDEKEIPEQENEPRKPNESMPNFYDSEDCKFIMEKCRSELLSCLSSLKKINIDGVIAKRIELKENIKHIEEIAEQLKKNLPTHTCPNCVGTGSKEGKKCKYCDGYGIVDQDFAEGLDYMWNKNKE